MDRIDKALNKLSSKERDSVKIIMRLIQEGQFSGLNLVKLKGNDYIYRVRKGKIRIIFSNFENNIKILVIERRNDNTYNDF